MKPHSVKKTLKITALILTTLVLLLGAWILSSQIYSLWTQLPHDTIRKNITIEEAQGLVSFSICIPAYIPPQIKPNPIIIYESDAANVPEETYIRLRYESASRRRVIFEVYQRYTHEETMKTSYPESESQNDGAVVSMLYWISYPKYLSGSKLETAIQQSQLKASVFQTNQTVWWLYEITDPIEYQSTMTEWMRDEVEYWILSYLPAEEIKKVTISMFGCSNP